MSWGYVAVAGATVLSSALGAKSSKDAARASGRGADAATEESARQYNQTRTDFAPWRTTGAGAINQLGRLFGLPTQSSQQSQWDDSELVQSQGGIPAMDATRYAQDPAYKYAWDKMLASERAGPLWKRQDQQNFYAIATDNDWNRINSLMGQGLSEYNAQNPQAAQQQGSGTPDMSAFFTSPGYQFRRDEGTRGINNSFAARGGALSGNALRALTEFNSNIASSEFGDYFNQLAGIAGIGQTATNQTAAYGADHAANAGRNALYAGDSRASGIIGQGNAIGQGIQGLAGLYGYYRNQPSIGSHGGTGAGGGSYPATGPRYV